MNTQKSAQFTNWALILGASLLGMGCSQGIDTSERSTAKAEQAVIGADTFLYFRSNASGWGVDDLTRLRPTLQPNIFLTTFPVTQNFMVSSGDNAQFVETNQLNGWGTSQTFSGSSVSPLLVPGSASFSGSAAFLAKYPALGTFQVSVDVNATPKTFSSAWRSRRR